MNFLILGDGPEELAWAQALAGHPEHRLWAACPGFKAFPDLPGGLDLDGALAIAGVEAAIVGGGPELRAEGLRRAAGAGLPVIVLHPPGPDADPYYNVALSRQETGAVVVPDLPARLHPGVAALGKALDAAGQGSGSRVVRYEMRAGPADGDLIAGAFARAVDVARALIGEVEAVTATGDPPGARPTERLVVQLRGPGPRRAEVRLEAGPQVEPARLVIAGAEGSLTLEHDPTFHGPSRLVRRPAGEEEVVTELDPWDPKDAILRALVEAVAGRPAHPDLLDGTRAMELAEAAARSLRRGRTVDLFYEEMSEAGNFKSVMTSTGCALLLGALVLYAISRAGQGLGFEWMGYLAWVIPPAFLLFILLQLLRYGIRKG
jgi:myo-inositol 2-dehydrogenase/D-chiro-inositol 1-dehydrogenase